MTQLCCKSMQQQYGISENIFLNWKIIKLLSYVAPKYSL